MNIIIKKSIDVTPALEDYLEKKFSQLDKFVAAIAKTNPAKLTVEIARTTNHHRKGNVYRAAAALRTAKVTLRADAEAEDIHTAIDAAKDILREEIEKQKARAVK
jgi:ribosomal subunit interface protein